VRRTEGRGQQLKPETEEARRRYWILFGTKKRRGKE
jgi:hypothetical protein